jgi:hypothetical protein
MTIDLREDILAFRNYIRHVVGEHIQAGKPKPAMIHFGFTFDQDGWIKAYLDTRPNASRDGEWTVHLASETLLPRPRWYEASELSDLRSVNLIGIDGENLAEWSAHPDLQGFANVLGDFIKYSVAIFIDEGLFQPLLGTEQLKYCVEELIGLYEWPVDPEIAKLAESLKLSGGEEMKGSSRQAKRTSGS